MYIVLPSYPKLFLPPLVRAAWRVRLSLRWLSIRLKMKRMSSKTAALAALKLFIIMTDCGLGAYHGEAAMRGKGRCTISTQVA